MSAYIGPVNTVRVTTRCRNTACKQNIFVKIFFNDIDKVEDVDCDICKKIAFRYRDSKFEIAAVALKS